MLKHLLPAGLLLIACAAAACAAPSPPDSLQLPATPYYEIETSFGRMVVRLYDETPVHRDNFKKLAAEGFYDGTAFHRIIEGFMIQGGDPNSKNDNPYDDGSGDPGYTLPAELVPSRYHKRGALAAARQGDAVNPERRSSGSQFYLVQGSTFDDFQLEVVREQIRRATGDASFTFSEEARAAYKELGGAPNLDAQYTVFGEIVEGLDVLDRIAGVDTPRKLGRRAPPALVDRPLQPVVMAVRPLPDYEPEAAAQP